MPRRSAAAKSKAKTGAPWYELLVKALPPLTAEAWFDWTSGIVFLNQDEATYQSYKKDGIQAQPEVAHAMTHEYVHVMQAAYCGFLNLWIRRQFDMMSAAMQELSLPVATTEETASILRSAPQKLSNELTNTLTQHREILNEKGPLDLTIRCIYEGHALFVQLHQHLRPLTAKTIAGALDQFSPALEYRLAYDIARQFCWDAAFEVFGAICFTSLCCTSPTDAFVTLCREVARRELAAVGKPLDDSLFIEAARQSLGKSLIGTTAELRLGEKQLPPIRQKIGSSTKTGRLTFREGVRLCQSPSGLLEFSINHLHAPVVLRPRSGDIPAIVDQNADKSHLFAALLIAAINSRMVENTARSAPNTGEETKYAWLQTAERRVLICNIARDRDPAADGEAFARNFSKGKAPKGKFAAHAHTWASWVLRSNIPHGVGLGSDPVVREFVSAAAREAPWFPLHLHMDCRGASFMTWFGSLASADAWKGTLFNTGDPSVREALVKAIDASLRRAQEIGQDATVQISAMTSIYAPAAAARMVAECPLWAEQLDRLTFELQFIAEHARAAVVSVANRSINTRTVARALAALGDLKFILCPTEINREILGFLQAQLQRGEGVLIIDGMQSKLLSDFAHDWAAFCISPHTASFVRSEYQIVLTDDIETLGFLAILRPGSSMERRSDGFELLTINAEEIITLENLGACSLQPILDESGRQAVLPIVESH